MENLRMFEIRYLPATDTKPSRMKIIDTRYKVSKIIYRTYDKDAIKDCIDFLRSKNINIQYASYNEKNYYHYLLTDNYTDEIK